MLYTCTLSLMPFPSLSRSLASEKKPFLMVFLHAVTGRSISVVLALGKVIRIVVLEFFFERERVEFATKRELVVDFFLTDVEVLDVKET